jgi:hypothetical protein
MSLPPFFLLNEMTRSSPASFGKKLWDSDILTDLLSSNFKSRFYGRIIFLDEVDMNSTIF